MSVVILHIVNGNLFLMGDKRITHVKADTEYKNGYIEYGHTDNANKVYKVNSKVLIGAAGSTIAYLNLMRDTINNNEINPKCECWDYKRFKEYYDFVFDQLYDWLDTDEKVNKMGEIAKTFRLVLCGVQDNKLHSTVYQYPSAYGKRPHETIFEENYNGVLVFSSKDLEKKYTHSYMSYPAFQSDDFSETAINEAFAKTLEQMSRVDNSISTNYDIFNIYIEKEEQNDE